MGSGRRKRAAWARCEAPVGGEDALASWQRCEYHYRGLLCRQSTDYRCGRAKGVCGSMCEFIERTAPLASVENIYAWKPHSHAWMALRKGEPVQRKRLVHLVCD